MIVDAFVVSRRGQVHMYHCFALSADGPCDCPLVLRNDHEPRQRSKVLGLGDSAFKVGPLGKGGNESEGVS